MGSLSLKELAAPLSFHLFLLNIVHSFRLIV